MAGNSVSLFLAPFAALLVAMLLTWPVEKYEQQMVKGSPRHLVVCSHGFMGHPCNCDAIADLVVRKEDNVLVHKSHANYVWPLPYSILPTFDGIDRGGERLAREIATIIEVNPQLETVSLIGISLGGLHARYAAARLFDRKTSTIAGLKPRYLITFASPHVGTRKGHNFLFAFMIKYMALSTGKQLVLGDTSNGALPLLERMGTMDHPLPFLEALAAFEHRVAYANIKNDDKVPFYSAAIHLRDTFNSADKTLLEGEPIVAVIKSNMPPNASTLDSNPLLPSETRIVTALRQLSWTFVYVHLQHPLAAVTAHDAISNSWWIAHYGEKVVEHLTEEIIDFENL